MIEKKICPYCNSTKVRKSGKLPSGKQRYLCTTCGKYHSEGNPIKKVEYHICPHCGGRTRKSGYNDSGSQRYLCLDCGKKSSGNTTLKYFRDYESGIECPFCHSKYIKKGGHLKDGTQRYECKGCKKFFSSKTIIKEDLGKECPRCHSHRIGTSGHNRNGSIRYRCLDCKSRFSDNPIIRIPANHPIQCPKCNHVGAKRAGKTGNGSQYYICKNCGHKYLEHPIQVKLSEEQFNEMIKERIIGIPVTTLSEKYNKSPKTIYNITKPYMTLINKQEIELMRLKHIEELEEKRMSELRRQEQLMEMLKRLEGTKRMNMIIERENMSEESRQNIKSLLKSGYEAKKISEMTGSTIAVIKDLEASCTRYEKLTEEQEQLIVKFGVGCSVPADYLAPYVPCSLRACKRVLSQYKVPEKKQFVVDEREKSFDKIWLNSFLGDKGSYDKSYC